jgi:Glycogen recognition site of AMP-activated protein kinase
LAENLLLRKIGVMGLMLVLLTGCASLDGMGHGNDAMRQISLFYEDPAARSVSVVGSFNAWTAGADPLVKVETGKWKGTIRLPKGAHQYMFVVNGETWMTDPKANRTLEDGFGRINGLLVVE